MSSSSPESLDIEAASYEINLEVDRGATFNQAMIWKNAQDMDFPLNPENPPIGVDLENCVGLMEVKKSHFSTEVLLTPTVTLEKDDVQGAVEFDITEADIETLLPRDKFSYSLTITFPSTRKRKLLRGKLTIAV